MSERSAADRRLPENFGSEVRPTHGSSTGEMEGAYRCVAVVDETPDHNADRRRQIAHRCRVTALVIDHSDLPLVGSESKYRGDETGRARTIEPRGAQNEMPRARRADCQFAAQFGCTINIDRIDRIALAPVTRYCARKHIVGGNMDQRNVGACAGGANRRRCQGVYGPCRNRIGFGGIDRSEGSRVDYGRPGAALN